MRHLQSVTKPQLVLALQQQGENLRDLQRMSKPELRARMQQRLQDKAPSAKKRRGRNAAPMAGAELAKGLVLTKEEIVVRRKGEEHTQAFEFKAPRLLYALDQRNAVEVAHADGVASGDGGSDVDDDVVDDTLKAIDAMDTEGLLKGDLCQSATRAYAEVLPPTPSPQIPRPRPSFYTNPKQNAKPNPPTLIPNPSPPPPPTLTTTTLHRYSDSSNTGLLEARELHLAHREPGPEGGEERRKIEEVFGIAQDDREVGAGRCGLPGAHRCGSHPPLPQVPFGGARRRGPSREAQQGRRRPS